MLLLDKIRQTATGLDLLPAWFIRTAAPFLALPLAHLFNLSISLSRVPTQWKVRSITPVHKITKPQTCQDYRPISITPVLSRWRSGSVVGRRTCDLVVAGSRTGRDAAA